MSRFIDVFNLTGSEMQKKGNFFALMFLVMGLGALVVYFALGWCSNIVAQVGKLITGSVLSSWSLSPPEADPKT